MSKGKSTNVEANYATSIANQNVSIQQSELKEKIIKGAGNAKGTVAIFSQATIRQDTPQKAKQFTVKSRALEEAKEWNKTFSTAVDAFEVQKGRYVLRVRDGKLKGRYVKDYYGELNELTSKEDW